MALTHEELTFEQSVQKAYGRLGLLRHRFDRARKEFSWNSFRESLPTREAVGLSLDLYVQQAVEGAKSLASAFKTPRGAFTGFVLAGSTAALGQDGQGIFEGAHSVELTSETAEIYRRVTGDNRLAELVGDKWDNIEIVRANGSIAVYVTDNETKGIHSVVTQIGELTYDGLMLALDLRLAGEGHSAEDTEAMEAAAKRNGDNTNYISGTERTLLFNGNPHFAQDIDRDVYLGERTLFDEFHAAVPTGTITYKVLSVERAKALVFDTPNKGNAEEIWDRLNIVTDSTALDTLEAYIASGHELTEAEKLALPEGDYVVCVVGDNGEVDPAVVSAHIVRVHHERRPGIKPEIVENTETIIVETTLPGDTLIYDKFHGVQGVYLGVGAGLLEGTHPIVSTETDPHISFPTSVSGTSYSVEGGVNIGRVNVGGEFSYLSSTGLTTDTPFKLERPGSPNRTNVLEASGDKDGKSTLSLTSQSFLGHLGYRMGPFSPEIIFGVDKTDLEGHVQTTVSSYMNDTGERTAQAEHALAFEESKTGTVFGGGLRVHLPKDIQFRVSYTQGQDNNTVRAGFTKAFNGGGNR